MHDHRRVPWIARENRSRRVLRTSRRCPPRTSTSSTTGLENLGLHLDPAVRDVVDGHARLLLAWTTAINLTAIRDPAGVARLHVLDSLAAVPVLAPRGVTGILDLGSGGGFPGLPLAAVLAPDRVLLVDSVAKKVGFLRTVVAATGLEGRVAAEAVRAETLARDRRDREAGLW